MSVIGETGRDWVIDQVITQHDRCPSRAIYLTGYSQGADAVGDALQDAPYLSQDITAAILWGDPQFQPSSDTAYGAYPHHGQGLEFSRGDFDSALVNPQKVFSICHDGDPVCGAWVWPTVPTPVGPLPQVPLAFSNHTDYALTTTSDNAAMRGNATMDLGNFLAVDATHVS